MMQHRTPLSRWEHRGSEPSETWPGSHSQEGSQLNFGGPALASAPREGLYEALLHLTHNSPECSWRIGNKTLLCQFKNPMPSSPHVLSVQWAGSPAHPEAG